MEKTINIKATNMELNNEVREYVDSRIKSLDKFIDATEKDTAIFDVEVGKTTTGQHTGNIFRAEINLRVHGRFYRAEAVTDHLFSATDQATSEIERQLQKSKKKRIHMFRRGAEKIKSILKWGK